jgi:putative exosortase-associated protein (TIGR04073 family)
MMVDSQSKGPAYGMTFGFIKGFWNAVFSKGSGIFDVATFMIPTKILASPKVILEGINKPTTLNI